MTAAEVVTMVVNGDRRSVQVTPQASLLDTLRWQLGLTGAKKCCNEGECGACTVLLDGCAVNSCLVLAIEADEAEITTIEGLAGKAGPSPLQEAFVSEGAIQCGFCIPGMVMAAHALLLRNADPTDVEIKEGLSGNLCRCAGYQRIVRAVRVASGSSPP